MLILGLVVCLVLASYVISLYLLFKRSPQLKQAPPPSRAPLISVIVPARNEERNLKVTLAALLGQDYPNFEVIAIDDNSSDATPTLLAQAAARDPRLHIVQGEPLAEGWTGKNFAVFQGAQVARGDWLLFVDADVSLAPGALSAAYQSAREHKAALFSLWPGHDLHGFWERTVQSVILAMHYFGELFQRLRKPWSLTAGPANGQFILISRRAYDEVGGHRAVRDSVLEDYELSYRLRRQGYATITLNGAKLAQVRMYASLGEIWQGWSKNTFLGMRNGPLETLGATAMVALVCCGPLALSLWAVLELILNPSVTAALGLGLAVASWLLLAAASSLLRPLINLPLGYLVSFPLGGLVLIGILLNSAYRHTLGNGVRWKGRRYGAATQRPVEP